MGITQQFIRMYAANDEETEIIIDKMDEETAKQILKVVMKEVKKHRGDGNDMQALW